MNLTYRIHPQQRFNLGEVSTGIEKPLGLHAHVSSRQIGKIVGMNEIMQEVTSLAENGSSNEIALSISNHHDRTVARDSIACCHGSSSSVNGHMSGGICTHIWVPKRFQFKMLRGIRDFLTNEQCPLLFFEKSTKSGQWQLTFQRSLREPRFLLTRPRACPDPIDCMPGRDRSVDSYIACSRGIVRKLSVVKLPYLPFKLGEHVTDSSDSKRPQSLERHLIRPFFHAFADSLNNKAPLSSLLVAYRVVARNSSREVAYNAA